MRSIRIFAKNMGDPYYEPTIMVHDTTVCRQRRLVTCHNPMTQNYATKHCSMC